MIEDKTFPEGKEGVQHFHVRGLHPVLTFEHAVPSARQWFCRSGEKIRLEQRRGERGKADSEGFCESTRKGSQTIEQ